MGLPALGFPVWLYFCELIPQELLSLYYWFDGKENLTKQIR